MLKLDIKYTYISLRNKTLLSGVVAPCYLHCGSADNKLPQFPATKPIPKNVKLLNPPAMVKIKG